MPLKDIGNGVGIADLSPFVTQAIQLRQLAGQESARAAQAEESAVDLENKKLEGVLKKNQVSNLDFDNEEKRLGFIIKKNSEQRAQADNLAKQLKELPGLFAQSPKMGQMFAKQLGFESAVNADGTITLMHGQKGKVDPSKTFTIDPMGIADPEKKVTMERPFRQDWEKKSAPYGIMSSAYNNMKKLALDDTGTSDIGILYSYIKLLDPNSAVKEGEIALANQTTNIPQWVVQKYNKAIDNGAPAFLPEQRQRFVKSAETLYQTARDNVIRDAKNTIDIVDGSKLRSRMVVTPVGDLNVEDFFGKQESLADQGDTGGAPPEGLPAPRDGAPAPKAKEASVVPGAKEEKPAPAGGGKKPKRVEDTLKNLFGGG